MDDYKPNSNRFKAEQKEDAKAVEKKEVQKVVTSPVKTKKKSEVSKLKDTFVSEDARNVGSYIVMDVLVPAAKKVIVDIITDGINMLLYGDSGHGKKRSNSEKVSYASYYDRGGNDRRSSDSRSRNRFDVDDIIFDGRGEAEAVLDRMEEMIDRYGFVTVADLYDMVDLTAPYTANKYGWTSVRTVEVVRSRDGYVLKLPRASAID